MWWFYGFNFMFFGFGLKITEGLFNFIDMVIYLIHSIVCSLQFFVESGPIWYRFVKIASSFEDINLILFLGLNESLNLILERFYLIINHNLSHLKLIFKLLKSKTVFFNDFTIEFVLGVEFDLRDKWINIVQFNMMIINCF